MGRAFAASLKGGEGFWSALGSAAKTQLLNEPLIADYLAFRHRGDPRTFAVLHTAFRNGLVPNSDVVFNEMAPALGSGTDPYRASYRQNTWGTRHQGEALGALTDRSVKTGIKLLLIYAGARAESARFRRVGGLQRSSPNGQTQPAGQRHHAISKPVHNGLERHPNLQGRYQVRDPRFVARASDPASHMGYQAWHRALDTEIVRWLSDHPHATQAQFESFLRTLYARRIILQRFPKGLEDGR